jgi:kynurenine formamidase
MSTTVRKPVGPTKGAALLQRRLKLIDLSQEIFEGMPTYFAHQKPFQFVNHTHAQSVELFGAIMPFEAHNILMSEHTGTHTDAIFEYDAEGPTLDESPLEYYYGDALCLDVSHVRYPDELTPEVLEAAERATGDALKEGDIVVLHTGHSDRSLPTRGYLEGYTGLRTAGATWLAEKGVVNIAIDAVSIDHSDNVDDQAHVVCGEYQIVNTEGLRNLAQVAGRRFTFLGLPLPIRRGTGSPIRAVALLDVPPAAA